MPTVTVDAHFSDYDDGTSFSWPAASVACSAGDIILANLGSQLSYTSTDGATTITFGQFWTGSAWSGTGVPYVNVAATTNLEDDNFADIEVLAAIDYYVDAHTNEYPVHQKSGHHAIHGGHVRNKAIGRKHAHPHHPGKHHITEAVFSVAQLGGTYNTVALGASEAAVTWTGGTFSSDGGGSIVGFSASGTSGAPASVSGPTTWVPLRCLEGDYIVLNNSGASITTLNYNSAGITIPNGAIAAVDGVDTTNDAYIGVYIIGRVSTAADAQTGLPWVHGWHSHAHQKHGAHIAGNAVDGDVHVKKNGHIREAHVGAGEIHGGEGGHTNHHAALSIDGGTHDHIIHNSIDGDVHINKNGHIRSTHVGAGEIHGGESSNPDHHAGQSHFRRHDHYTKPHRHHWAQVIFSISGGGSPYTVSWTGGFLLHDDGAIIATITAGSRTVASGDYFVYDTGTSSFTDAASFDANAAANDGKYLIGRLTSNTDPQTGVPWLTGWHVGSHQSHGGHIAAGAIDGVQHIKQNGNIHSAHIGSSQIIQSHLNGQVVGLGNLKNPGSGGVAVTSGQDTWSTTFSGSWVMRNWANISPPANGSLTGGNMGSMTVGGSQYQVEVQLKNTAGTWGAYHRVYRMFPQVNASSVPNEAQILSDDTNWEIYVQRFDILTDGTVACVIGTFGTGTISIGVQFRIVWAIQS